MNEAEKKIVKALDTAIEHKNAGLAPDDALTKAAMTHGLNSDMTERMVEAFNIALVNSSIRRMDDKTASFPVGNKDTVMSAVFNRFEPADRSKTAGAENEEFFSVVHPKNISLGWGETKTPLAKTAGLELTQIAHAYGACDLLRAGLSKLAQDCISAELRTNDSFSELCNHLAESGNHSKFAGLEHQALYEYGEGVKPLMQELYEAARLEHSKVARFSGMMNAAFVHFPKSATWDLLQGFINNSQSMAAAVEKRQKEGAAVQSQIDDTYRMIRQLSDDSFESTEKSAADLLVEGGTIPKLAYEDKGDETPSSGVDPVGMLSKAVASPFDRGNSFVSSVQSGVSGALADSYQKAHIEATKNHMRGPKDEADAEKDNLIRQSILSELVNNDEIVSRMPHKDIEHSYGSLLSLSPTLTLDHNLVRGWLRNSAATQALDPFTAGSLIKVEQDARKNKLLASGQLKPA